MAVNNVEIKVGQKWKTYMGHVVTIDRITETGFLVIDEAGSTYAVNERGQTDATAFLAVDLESLVADSETAELPIVNVDANADDSFSIRFPEGLKPGPVHVWVKRTIQPGEEQPDPLAGMQVRFADAVDDTADPDQLASETLSALGWTFDGQCWVQPEQVNWPTGTQSALDIQHGGDHYKGFTIQPVEFIHANNLPFIEGNCIKYLMRWREKGGVKDLDKVKHYVDLLIELEAKHTKAF